VSRAGAGGLRAGIGRVLLAAIIVSAVAGVLWYRRLAQESGPAAPPPGPPESSAEMVLRDFRHVESRMDRTVWVLESKRAEVTGDVAKLSTVKITWYGDDPRQLPVVITSSRGEVNLRTSNAILAGKVRLVRSDGASLVTRRLVWNNRRRELRAPFHVLIRTPDLRFRGGSMVADLERQSMRLTGSVRGTVGGRPAGPAPARSGS